MVVTYTRRAINVAWLLIFLLTGAAARLPKPKVHKHDLGTAPKFPKGYRPVRRAAKDAGAAAAAGGARATAGTVAAAGVTSTRGLIVDTSKRTSVKRFFNTYYMASENVSPGWTGSVDKCSPGYTASAYTDATLRRINWYRAMAGVPAFITLNSNWSRMCQEVALMMVANEGITHYPPPDWKCYDKDAAAIAGVSNLSLGNKGPAAVNSQMRDKGSNNAGAGHRRWLLYPPTRTMGVGSADYVTQWWYDGGAAFFIWDTTGWEKGRPATRSPFIAWPPPGYVPYQVVWTRWSFSLPWADFSKARVRLTRYINGTTVDLPVVQEAVEDGMGDNTLVWQANGMHPDALDPWPQPQRDTGITVRITGVNYNGRMRSFLYIVRIFDPAT